ncbi:hypothetical protein HWD94_13315 [Pseudarthrobacter equi]|uniref:hypothetical protein n=1 Tax=Pseudarthrobacter equi TaxID=728066 RepID=UPI0021BE15ED|nr:hypothetical protein [Pseudarthrobacter equi]MCT9626095.1 hypothetical protein [Pseudarthrobacter equi]
MAYDPDGEERLRTTPTGTAPPSGPAQPSPPPRPGLSYAAPAPIAVAPPVPGAVRLARALWLLSFVAGLTVLVGSFLSRDGHLERLRSVVDGMAPGGDAEAVSTASGIVFWGSVGALLLVILLEAALLGAVLARHNWARWALVPLLAVHAVATLLATAFLMPEGDSANYVMLLWGAQLLLTLVGLVLLFLPASNAWLKSRRTVRR